MRALVDGVRVVQHSLAIGLADYGTIYTPRTWTFGWLMRMSAQMIFYALIGRLLDSEATVRFLLIGNVSFLAATSAFFVIQSSTWERRTGTLPLLVAAPAPLFLTFTGRSVQWIGEGVLTATGALVVAGPLFGVWPGWRLAGLIPLFMVIALSSYGMGLFLGAVVLRFPESRNLWFNVVIGVMAIICGVNVPVSFFPSWVEAVAQAIPLTHGLEAIRGLVDGDGAVAVPISLCLAVGAIWAILAAMTFERLAQHDRRAGTIEFGT